MDVTAVFSEILRKGASESEVARLAGFSPRFLYDIRKGRRSLSPRVIVRIKLALARIQRGDRHHDGQQAAAAYRLALATVARKMGADPRLVLEADPSKRATADPVWLQAAKVRRVALYIANVYLNVPQAELARAAGMSKAAVSIAMNEVEEMRDSAELEQLLAPIEEAFA